MFDNWAFKWMIEYPFKRPIIIQLFTHQFYIRLLLDIFFYFIRIFVYFIYFLDYIDFGTDIAIIKK